MGLKKYMPAPRIVAAPAELLPFLFAAWPDVKKKQVRTWLRHKAVTVNGRPTSQFDLPLQIGDQVAIRMDRFTPPDTVLANGIRLLHEDAAILVIDKPAGLLSIASEKEELRTAYFQVTEHLRQGNRFSKERVWIVHRLDRETSGLMVFAKTEEAKHTLQEGWDKVEKRYVAAVEGAPPAESGAFDCYLDESDPFKVRPTGRQPGARRAVTRYRVLKKNASYALVELILETGRRHQIRVHLAEAGCPIVGDSRYGTKSNPIRRVGLHACLLRFPHPGTGEEMSFQSPAPPEMVKLVQEGTEKKAAPRAKTSGPSPTPARRQGQHTTRPGRRA
jgi:23S rRNA pseudouridine1911/1915/1917 synthase